MELTPHIAALMDDISSIAKDAIVKRSDLADLYELNSTSATRCRQYKEIKNGTADFNTFTDFPVEVLSSMKFWCSQPINGNSYSKYSYNIKEANGKPVPYEFPDGHKLYVSTIDPIKMSVEDLSKLTAGDGYVYIPPQSNMIEHTVTQKTVTLSQQESCIFIKNTDVNDRNVYTYSNVEFTKLPTNTDRNDNSTEYYSSISDEYIKVKDGFGNYVNARIEENTVYYRYNNSKYYGHDDNDYTTEIFPFQLTDPVTSSVTSGSRSYYTNDPLAIIRVACGEYVYNDDTGYVPKTDETTNIFKKVISIRLKLLVNTDSSYSSTIAVDDLNYTSLSAPRKKLFALDSTQRYSYLGYGYVDFSVPAVTNSDGRVNPIQLYYRTDIFKYDGDVDSTNDIRVFTGIINITGTTNEYNVHYYKYTTNGVDTQIFNCPCDSNGDDILDPYQKFAIVNNKYYTYPSDAIYYQLYDNFDSTIIKLIHVNELTFETIIPDPVKRQEYIDAYTTLASQYVRNTYCPKANTVGIKVDIYDGEENQYYRMLNGLPPLDNMVLQPKVNVNGTPTYVYYLTDEKAAELTAEQITTWKLQYKNTEYLDYLGRNRIDVIKAREESAFGLLKTGSYVYSNNYALFISSYRTSRNYITYKYYNKELYSGEEYYESYISFMILIYAMCIAISKSGNSLIFGEYNDRETVDRVLESYGYKGVFDSIPLVYRRNIARNIRLLIKNKGLSTLYGIIYNVFNTTDFDIVRYYLCKYNNDGTQDLCFVEDSTDSSAVINMNNKVSYDTLTNNDIYWAAGQSAEAVKTAILGKDFNYVSSKYLGISNKFSLTELNFNSSYLLNYLLDGSNVADNITIEINGIQGEHKLHNVLILLYAIQAELFGYDGNIPSSIYPITKIYKFNTSTTIDDIQPLIDKLSNIDKAKSILSSSNFGTHPIKFDIDNRSTTDNLIDGYNENLQEDSRYTSRTNEDSFYNAVLELRESCKNPDDYILYNQILDAISIADTSNAQYEIDPKWVTVYECDIVYNDAHWYYGKYENLLDLDVGTGTVVDINGNNQVYECRTDYNWQNNDAVFRILKFGDSTVSIQMKTNHALSFKMYLDETDPILASVLVNDESLDEDLFRNNLNETIDNIIYYIEESMTVYGKATCLTYTNATRIASYIRLVLDVFKSYTTDIVDVCFTYLLDDKTRENVKLLDKIQSYNLTIFNRSIYNLYSKFASNYIINDMRENIGFTDTIFNVDKNF